MNKETLHKTILGAFVTVGIILLIIAVYIIGSKKNIFSRTMEVSAVFKEVNGLQGGNNVRFRGIDVGTIKDVLIENDSTVKVIMIIEHRICPFINKNAIVSIGTDGLMGNKIVNIHNQKFHSSPIEEDDMLQAEEPIATDEVFRTLTSTNENIREVTEDLKTITKRLNSGNNVWTLLSDTAIAENLKHAIVNIKMTSNRSALISGDLSSIVRDVKSGKGSVGALLTDTSFEHKLNQSIVNIKMLSDSVAEVTGDLKEISSHVKKGEGALGTILMDTTFVNNLNKSMENIKNASGDFEENMEALKHSIFLRKYFKQKQKSQKAKNSK